MKPNGKWPDLLDLWLDYTSSSRSSQSPSIFRLWSGLYLISASLERRVYVLTGKTFTYPNLYVMLVGSPGVGKQVIDEVRDFFSSIKRDGSLAPAFHIASDSVTTATLVDELEKAKQTILTPSGPPSTYHCLALIQEEFRVLLPAYDQTFISKIDKLFNGVPTYSESRRHGPVREITITSPLLNMLVGAQPAYLTDTFPENAWNTGLCRRLLMIYSAEGSDKSIFDLDESDPELESYMRHYFGLLGSLSGVVKWTQEAATTVQTFEMDIKRRMKGDFSQIIEDWPMPSHGRLTHYNRSRTMMLIKLSTICAIASRFELVIRQTDVERALTYLLQAESLMPDIFLEMRGKSDREVMEEMHRFAMVQWGKDRGKPLHISLLANFLSHRLPSEKVDRVLALSERARIFVRLPGTEMVTPQPLFDHRGGKE